MGRSARERAALRELQRTVWGDRYYARHLAAQRRTEARRRTGTTLVAVGALFVAIGLVPAANATQPNPEHKVTLCHATDSYSNPYVVITVDIASVKFQGHNGHEGPVFFPAIPKHTKWGDIIPPFDYGPGRTYAGKNWTADGMAIHDNGCVLPPPPVTTAPPTTAPPTTAPPTSTTLAPTTTAPTTAPPTTAPPTSTTLAPTTTLPGTTTTVPTGTTSSTSTTTPIEPSGTTTTVPAATTTIGEITTTLPGTPPRLPPTGGIPQAFVLLGFTLMSAGVALTRRRARV